MSSYLPVPVDAARQIAHQFEKDVVVVVSVDNAFGQIHVTTYGKQPSDKITAAELGPVLATAAGGFTPASTMFEDFRDSAVSAQKFDELHAAASRVLAGLNARIDAAPDSAKPVFDGIAELHAVLSKMNAGTKSESEVGE